MGNGNFLGLGGGGLSESELEAIRGETSTPLQDAALRAAYKGFRKNSSKGAVTKQEFAAALFDGGIKRKLLAEQFWAVFYRGAELQGQPVLSFADLVEVLSLLLHGQPAQKYPFLLSFFFFFFSHFSEKRLKLCFRLLDADGDGFVSKSDLVKMVTEVHSMCGQLVSYSGKVFATPEECAEDFFAKAGPTAKEGKISLEEYEKAAFRSLDVISTLALYGSSATAPLALESNSSSSTSVFGPRLPDSVII